MKVVKAKKTMPAKIWNKRYPDSFKNIFSAAEFPEGIVIPSPNFLFDVFIDKFSSMPMCNPMYKTDESKNIEAINNFTNRVLRRSMIILPKYNILNEIQSLRLTDFMKNYSTHKESSGTSHKGKSTTEYKNSIQRVNDIVTTNSYSDTMQEATDDAGTMRNVRINSGTATENSEENHNTNTTNYTVNGNNYTVESKGDPDNEDAYYSTTDSSGYYNSKPMIDVIKSIDVYSDYLNIMERWLDDIIPAITLSYFDTQWF
jgi:hypothetical protein